MASILVLDTHALIWFLQGDPRLGTEAKAALADPAATLVLPAIVLAEAVWIVERGRTNIPSPADLLAALAADSRITIVPLTGEIVERTISLTSIPEMHDRQIVATAQLLGKQGTPATLVSMDAEIRDSRLVPLLW
jgi:PIN domain nuclease of toxin-antitoxin system